MSTRVVAVVDPGVGPIEGRTADGHRILMDGMPPHGGDTAAAPIETLLAALAGCTALDVRSILRKKRQTAVGYEIEVTAERAPDHPRVLTSVVVEHRVRGSVDPEALRRSIELSATQYCPINAMLAASARIEHRYLLESDGGAADAAVVVVLGPGEPRRQP